MHNFFAALTRTVALMLCLAMPLGSQIATAESPASGAGVSQSLLLEYLADNSTFTLIDARAPLEFAASHIAGAINLPPDADFKSFSALPDDRGAPIVVYCKTGKRANILRQKLMDAGYTNVRVLQPTQIVWFDGMAVFNCSAETGNATANSINYPIVEGERSDHGK